MEHKRRYFKKTGLCVCVRYSQRVCERLVCPFSIPESVCVCVCVWAHQWFVFIRQSLDIFSTWCFWLAHVEHLQVVTVGKNVAHLMDCSVALTDKQIKTSKWHHCANNWCCSHGYHMQTLLVMKREKNRTCQSGLQPNRSFNSRKILGRGCL